MHDHNQCIARTRRLTFEDVVGETVKQTVVRTVIDLTELKKIPAEQIIDVFASARIISQRIVDGKVVFEGEVAIKVLYEAKTHDQQVLVAEATVRFSDFVDIKGALPTDRLFLTVAIEDVEARLVAQTRIAVTVVLRVTVKVVREQKKTVVIDVKGPKGLVVRRELLKLRRVLAEGVKQVLLREVQSLRDLGKPPFAQLIDVFSVARVTSTRVIEDKVLFEGVVEIKILYATPKQQVVVVTQEDTFSDFIELPGARPGMPVEVSVAVELVTVQAEDRTGDGKLDTLVKTIVLRAAARVFETIELKVVVNVFGIPGVKLRRQLVRVEDVVGVGEIQIIVRERLDPKDKHKPCVVQVIDCRAFPVIKEVRLINDKVVVLGRVEIKVIYESKNQTVHVLRGEFPFQGFADVPGVRPGQTEFTAIRVLDVTCVIAPDSPAHDKCQPHDKCPPVDATVVLLAETKVIQPRQLEVVTAVFCPGDIAHGIGKGVVIADRVHVRSGPSTTFPVIATVDRGTHVVVLAEVGQFFKVFIPKLKIEGFIFKRFIRFEKPLG